METSRAFDCRKSFTAPFGDVNHPSRNEIGVFCGALIVPSVARTQDGRLMTADGDAAFAVVPVNAARSHVTMITTAVLTARPPITPLTCSRQTTCPTRPMPATITDSQSSSLALSVQRRGERRAER